MTIPTNLPTAEDVAQARHACRPLEDGDEHGWVSIKQARVLLAYIDHLEEVVVHLTYAHRSCTSGCDQSERIRELSRRVKGGG